MCMFLPNLQQATLLLEAVASPCCSKNKLLPWLWLVVIAYQQLLYNKEHALTYETPNKLNMTYVCDMK